MTRILHEGIHSGEFLVWESHPYFCRVNALISPSEEYLVGTPFLVDTATGEFVAIDETNVDDLVALVDGEDVVPASATFGGFLIDAIMEDKSEAGVVRPPVPRGLLAKGPAIVNPAHINFPAGADAPATAALKAKIVAAAAALQIQFEV